MVPRMERFQLSKVVTVSSTDGPTVHPRLPDCPSWAARLSTWQAPTVHRSVGQGGPTVHRVGRLPVRQPDCPRARLRLSRASVGLPTRHRRTVHGQPGLPRRAAPTAHAGSRRQPDCRQASARLLSSRIFTAPTFGQPAGRRFGTRTSKADPDLEGGPGPRRSDRRRALGRRFRWIGGPFAMPRARRPFRCTLAHARRPWISSVHHAHYARSCHAKARVPTSNARSRTSLQASGTGSRRAGIPAISGLVRHACVRRPAACATSR